uniref:Dedicator of cytokinesis 4 n=1 Tax=Cyprinus carpio TaxID=7962 RepID=A0A8C1NUB5_CYPCA
SSYIHLKNAHVKNKGQFETVIPTEDSVITEITMTLRDWGTMWKQLYMRNEGDLFHRLWHVMNEILELRQQVLVGHLTHDRLSDIKQHITARLDWGNEQLGLDLVPRRDFSMVDPDEISITELYRLVGSHTFMLTYIERFFVRLNKQGLPKSPEKTERQCTLFVVSLDLFRVHQGHVLEIYIKLKAYYVHRCNAESEWYQIHDSIIRKVGSRYSHIGTNTGLNVSLQLLHGDMEQIRKDYMRLFTRNVSITKRLGFSDIIIPGEIRNDLYVTLERGEFEKGGKSVARNVEVTVYLLGGDGQGLVCCGSGEPGVDEHRSFVLYHSNSPRWAEQIKLPIPLEMFHGTHLRFELRHCSSKTPLSKEKGEKKLFGFSFVPLMQDDGRPLPDGTHELIVHKCEETADLQDPARYLKLPFSKASLQPGNNQTIKNSKESFWIQSSLCSTKLTQNGDMLDLLKWRVHPDRIIDCLPKLKDIDGTEIVKFLQDTLDTLFGILDESPQRYGLKVFDCLVHVINLLQDSKFQLFKPVMDNYIENHFAGALSYRQFLFLFFTDDKLFLQYKGISPITHTQAVFLRSFPTVCCELLKIFSMREVANLARDTLSSLPALTHTDCPLQAVKLQCMAKTVDSPLYINPESRCVLLPVVLRLLHTHLQEQRELVLCANILTSMLTLNTPATECGVSEEVNLVMESLSGVLLRTILEYFSKLNNKSDVCVFQGEFVACLLTLLQQLKDKEYQQLLSRFPTKDELTSFLLQLFTVFRILIRPDMFPKDWTVMRLVANNVIITTILYLSDTLRNNFLNEKFDFKVRFYIYYSCGSIWVRSLSQICIEHLWSHMTGAYKSNVWCCLPGDYKLNLIPTLIGPFMEVTLVPQMDLRNVLIPIFHDMMDCEQQRSGNFKQVEAKLIDKLDGLMSEGKGDETYRELFNNILLKKIERETWRESGVSHIATVTRLMERLLDYRKKKKTSFAHIVIVTFQNFYKTELNKEEMYIRYIHKLYELHLKAQNYTEASYTLLLYDELLEWTERPLREFLTYPMQSEWQRKECLHLTIVHNFDRGKCWENCIILCRELANQYEAYYDYRNLSKMRMMEASFYDKIMNQQRLEPEFFRVGFYGKKFPFFLRNKEFVCRGNDYERLEAFQQRMLSEFPHAIAMQHANLPDQTIHQADAQYLQIYAVCPVPENQDVLQRDGVPNNIKSFYKVNHIWRFRYDRPFHKGTKDKENEFKSLWVERTTLTLAQSLPGISRWFEVEKRELVNDVFPSTSPPSKQSYNHKHRHHNLSMLNINPLTMCLNGVIDAAVNGGLARYQEAFFAKDYIANHPEDGEKITRLRELMFEQAHILEFGLAVHEKFVPQDMRPLHKKLIDQFHVMRSSLGIQVCVLLHIPV